MEDAQIVGLKKKNDELDTGKYGDILHVQLQTRSRLGDWEDGLQIDTLCRSNVLGNDRKNWDVHLDDKE